MENLKKQKVELRLIEGENRTELSDGYIILPIQKKKFKEAFIMVFQSGLEYIATDKRLTGRDKTVIMFLLSKMEFENWIHINQSVIAEKLNIAQPHISTILNKLTKCGYLDKIKDGKNNAYRFNEVFVWKGKAATRDNLIKLQMPGQDKNIVKD
jgi:hypothetical protein